MSFKVAHPIAALYCTRKRCRHVGSFLAVAWRVNTDTGILDSRKFYSRISIGALPYLYSTLFDIPDGVTYLSRPLLVLSSLAHSSLLQKGQSPFQVPVFPIICRPHWPAPLSNALYLYYCSRVEMVKSTDVLYYAVHLGELRNIIQW